LPLIGPHRNGKSFTQEFFGISRKQRGRISSLDKGDYNNPWKAKPGSA